MSKALEIRSLVKSIRRAGRRFGKDAVTIPLDDLDDDDIEALKNEPRLSVQEVDVKDTDAKNSEDKPKSSGSAGKQQKAPAGS